MLILMLVLAVLSSTPSMISPGGVSLVATEIQHSSGNEIFVRTKLDFAQPEQMERFPRTIGDWHSVNYDWSALKESLGADILLSRAYVSNRIESRLLPYHSGHEHDIIPSSNRLLPGIGLRNRG
jgi:hypothetical protein